MLVSEPYSLDKPLVVGHYYSLVYHFGIDIAESFQGAVTWSIMNAPDFIGPIKVKNVKYEKLTEGGKRAGMDMIINFQALPHPSISQSGMDPRAIILIVSGLLIGVLAFTGTFKAFFRTVDKTTDTVEKVLDPAVIVGIIIFILVFSQLRR